MNMIIGKRQIILAALVLGLGVAVYLNWQYTRVAVELPVTEMLEWEGTSNYGEAQYVGSPALMSTDIEQPLGPEAFFVEAQISRQRSRDQAAETLAVMLNDADLSSEQRAELAMRAVELAGAIETEGKIENMIRGRGFDDVMVYYDSRRADVMVRTDGLLSNEAAQIKEIILRETDLTAQYITIVEIN
ncbi:MAG: SpoIIIAH-like family protein [Oscillospiraceae bacterium]|nr:SpoIIIAH-like family protein [Oscillospiraceae bacterium]